MFGLLQANVCDAAGVTPAQLSAGSSSAELLPTSDGPAAAGSGQLLSRPGTPDCAVGAATFASGSSSAAQTLNPKSKTAPLAAQQDAWHSFQRRSLISGLERRHSAEFRAGPPLVCLADGFEASPRPRQRRSLEANRPHYNIDPRPRASLDGGAGCCGGRASFQSRGASNLAPPLTPHLAMGNGGAAAAAAASARVASPPPARSGFGSSFAAAGPRIVSGRGWDYRSGGSAAESLPPLAPAAAHSMAGAMPAASDVAGCSSGDLGSGGGRCGQQIASSSGAASSCATGPAAALQGRTRRSCWRSRRSR